MKRVIGVAVIVCFLASGGAWASSITPAYDTFGPLPAATFGGSGIPNDAVAISTWTDGTVTITLGLTATERYANPPVTDDGAGTYTALAGSDLGYAMWNFDYYIEVVGGTYAAYDFRLLYDFDPAVGNDSSGHGSLYVPGTLIDASLAPRQGSENLAMPWLDSASPPYVTPPGYLSFSPTAAGEYTFALQAYVAGGTTPLDTAAIRVNAAPVPEPATITVMGLGLASLAAAKRIRSKFAAKK